MQVRSKGARFWDVVHFAELLQVVAEVLRRDGRVGAEEIPMETERGHLAVLQECAKVARGMQPGSFSAGEPVLPWQGQHTGIAMATPFLETPQQYGGIGKRKHGLVPGRDGTHGQFAPLKVEQFQ